MIEIRNIHLTLGKRFSFDMEEFVSDDSLLILRGTNGSGKSTFLHLLLGLRKPQRGIIKLNGVQIPSGRQFVNSAIESLFFPKNWSLEQALRFELKKKPSDTLEEVRKNLWKAFEADRFANKRLDQMSAGMLQKSNILLSLCGQPAFLLLDEPEAHLDEASISVLLTTFEILLSRKVCVISATHTTHYWEGLISSYPSSVLDFPVRVG